MVNRTIQPYENIAVGIDARSESHDLRRFSEIIKLLRELDINIEVIYLQAELATLIKRFSDPRRRHPLADVAAKAAAPIGATFTFIVLVTGSLWGKPMWGTYWVWDARLTSVLILFFLYLGYIALVNAFDDPGRWTILEPESIQTMFARPAGLAGFGRGEP